MSLFVGNLSSSIKRSELEEVFEKIGKCKIQLKVL
jgi:RNA recognition motif-containing protein